MARVFFVAGLVSLVLAGTTNAFEKNGKSYALLIGINEYDSAHLPPLKYAENDIEQLAAVLDRPGSPFAKRVRVLTGSRGKASAADKPTLENLDKAIRSLVKDRTRHDVV